MRSELCPYEDDHFLVNHASNKTLGELRAMTEQSLFSWALNFREAVVHAWDELGVPVIGGAPADDIVDQFQKLSSLDVSDILFCDTNTGRVDCLMVKSGSGAAANQFFPTMLKTKDIRANTLDGVSVYSYFADEQLLMPFCKFVRQMLEQDPFEVISSVVKQGDCFAVEWISSFSPNAHEQIWLRGVTKPKAGQLVVERAEAEALLRDGILQADQIAGEHELYRIHRYDPSKRIVDYRKVFRLMSGGPPASNFSPAIAKYLYLKFTEHLPAGEKAIVYDPSAGWGGRILGAMACHNERRIHYVGTDPNSDHWMNDLEVTKYGYLADYFNGNIRGKYRNTYEIFRCGSELIEADKDFHKYEGKVDFVFTSPPYFAAEGYSDEATQSHVKYPSYEDWRDGFLRDTLTTAVRWLAENRYLCLNIADVRFNSLVLPLQQDAVNILTELGLWRHPDLKMVLQTSPGEPKETARGIPTIRNFCTVNGKRRKYEPILVFQKLVGHDEFAWGNCD